MPASKYSAAKAATVGVAIAVATAILLGIAGYLYVQEGEPVGWLLILLGIVPLIFAIVVRVKVSGPNEGSQKLRS
jgi:hypothetical protein